MEEVILGKEVRKRYNTNQEVLIKNFQIKLKNRLL